MPGVPWGGWEAVSRMQNQAVGDALANLFLVEAIVKRRPWAYEDWNQMHADVPCCHLKVDPWPPAASALEHCTVLHCTVPVL